MPKTKTALNHAKSLISSEKQPAKILETPEKPNSGRIAAVLIKMFSIFKIKKGVKDVAAGESAITAVNGSQ